MNPLRRRPTRCVLSRLSDGILHIFFGQAVALWQAFYRSSYSTLYLQPKLTDHDPDDDDVSADGDDQHESEQDGPDDL